VLRFSGYVLCWVSGLLTAVGSLPAQEVRPAEDLFPSTTVAFVATPDFQHLSDQFNKTQVGQLTADPVMQPFTEDLRRQFTERWFSIEERLGVTLDELRKIAGGELGMGRIRPAPGKAAVAVAVDVTGNLDETVKLLKKVSDHFTKQRRAARSVFKIDGCPEAIIRFDIPPGRDDPKAGPSHAFYCLTGNLLCASDDEGEIRGIVRRISPGGKDSLANWKPYQEVMKRCAADQPEAAPQLRWYIHPLGYAEVLYLNTPEDQRRKGKANYQVMAEQGFGAIRGAGGFGDFGTEGFEFIYRSAVYAPPPYRLAMKMMVFPNGRDFAPQRWVPRDIAAYSTLYTELLNAFDNFDSMFDEMQGGSPILFRLPAKHQSDLQRGVLSQELRGAFAKEDFPLPAKATLSTRDPGSRWKIIADEDAYVIVKKGEQLDVYMEIWHDALYSLKHDEDGPQIDLRNELIAHLGQRVTMISDYELPITTTSERILLAFETKDEKAVAKAVQKNMEADKSVKRHVVDGNVIWEIIEEEEAEGPKEPSGSSLAPPKRRSDDQDEQEDARLLPHAAVTVSHGHMFIASHYDFLLKILKPREERETLARSIDYRRVAAAVEQLGVEQQCMRMFSRTDEEYRATYELIRQGKMPEAETVFGRLLNRLLGADSKGPGRKQQIDGSKMPDYDVVRRHLGPAGMVASSEKDGWFVKGFTLKKE